LQRSLIRPLSLLVPAALAALAACGNNSSARADTVSGRDSASGDVTARASQGIADTTRKDSSRIKGDSTKAVIQVKVAPGRPKKDSLALVSALRVGLNTPGWPVKGPEPAEGSILPQKRIVAFYGNPYNRRMGILGALPPNQMQSKLEEVARDWQAADPDTPVQPALHLIAVVAQADPGSDGKYRLRMDSALIEQVYGWAQQKGWLLFLDIQTGQSTVMEELPRLMKWL